MRRDGVEGFAEFRPTITASSVPLAVSALGVVAVMAGLAWLRVLPAWTVAVAIAGAFLQFCVSFIMPWLQTVRVRPGELHAPAGYGDNILKLERIDLSKCKLDSTQAIVVDDLGSRIVLRVGLLSLEEIVEILVIFGLDPRAIAEVQLRARVSGRSTRHPA